MSQPLKKDQIIALFGKKAASRLFALLDPCCGAIDGGGASFRLVPKCVEGKMCLDVYMTSTVSSPYTFVNVGFPDFNEFSKIAVLTAGEEKYIGEMCTKTSYTEGEVITGIAAAYLPGLPVIPQLVSFTAIDCTAPLEKTSIVLTGLAGTEADGTVTNGYLSGGATVRLQESVTGLGGWADVAFSSYTDPFTGAVIVYYGPGPGLFYRLEAYDYLGVPIQSNILAYTPPIVTSAFLTSVTVTGPGMDNYNGGIVNGYGGFFYLENTSDWGAIWNVVDTQPDTDPYTGPIGQGGLTLTKDNILYRLRTLDSILAPHYSSEIGAGTGLNLVSLNGASVNFQVFNSYLGAIYVQESVTGPGGPWSDIGWFPVPNPYTSYITVTAAFGTTPGNWYKLWTYAQDLLTPVFSFNIVQCI